MVRTLLSDEVWNKVQVILPGKEDDRGRTASNNRWFLEAVLWISRTGSPWRDLPAEFGRWHTVYIRFSRWRSKGVWARVANALAGETEIEHILIDSTIVRAHQRSAAALKKGGPQALGRSRGGLSTNLHLAVDSKGRPLRLIFTEGQVADISCAAQLVEHLRTGAVIADKGYDADHFVQRIRATRAKVVILPCSNRKTKRRYNRALYGTRNLVERFFNRVKHFRRVSTRYDKLAESYLVFASLACAFGPVVNVNTA
ncbi:IS5 family transposase [Paraburkholderia elongata]|uniref:IS5 family transposase n=1 Tax=Paraburkholderia elongata TaxID=2675747 RepID=A0A972NZD7_9BURK|nr:IS5 family transposase [Paraburkholderia elongata]NPT62631.1 IS5 family transposase [Paraburkholderia elongata]